MPKTPVLSGAEIIKNLCNKKGFQTVGQRGSHVRLKKFVDGKPFIVIVPMAKEIPVGTLKSIIRQSGLTEEEFLEMF